ncbi:MAG: hypothetical protein KatS3mg081_1079 [Gemmatimonadales bacterium]|nr:MAG: hypothetical protein KatS3mg081_1079 [Gemmatimonadales bacterium]
MTQRLRQGAPRAAAWLVLTLLLWLALKDIPWGTLEAALDRARPSWLAASVLLNLTILPLGAIMWRFLLPQEPPVKLRTLLWTQALTSTISTAAPFPSGHLAGVYILAKRGAVGYETAISLRTLDQVVEAAAKVLLVAVALALIPLPRSLQLVALGAIAGFLGLATAVGIWAGAARYLHSLARRRGDRTARVLRLLAAISASLRAERRRGALAGATAMAVLRKAAEGAAIWCAASALEAQVPTAGILLALAAVNLATLAPLTPASLGVYEAAAFGAYQLVGVSPATALTLAVVQHAAYLVALLGPGWFLPSKLFLKSDPSHSRPPRWSTGAA